MKFSLFSLMPLRDTSKSPAKVLSETTEMVQLAEQVGFDTVWFAEHHFGNYCMCPSPLIMAAHCAAKTKRIKLGTGILILPLYHPLRVLQEIGLVDHLSDGRLVVGIGSGYQEYEFVRYGVPIDERWERTHEVLDIIEMAGDHGHVRYSGKHFDIPDSPIALARPELGPIYVAGNEPEMLKRMARRGHVPFATVGSSPIEALIGIRQHVERCFAEAGVSEVPLAIQRMVHVTDSKSDALSAAEHRLYTDRLINAFREGRETLNGWELEASPFVNEPTPEAIVENNPVGDAETCAERILSEIDIANPTEYSCFMQVGGMDGDSSLRSLEKFGEQVLPIITKQLSSRKPALIGAQA